MFNIFRDLSAGANSETNIPALACSKISAVLLGKLLPLYENRQHLPFTSPCSKAKPRGSVLPTRAQELG